MRLLAINTGYLTASKNDESNENYTPYYAVDPIVKYISKNMKIWCPFDEEWSAYYNSFKEQGFDVIRSSIQEGQDFFKYEPDNYDIIVSNPPFNIKDKILKRLDELRKPFAILLPLNSLQGSVRYGNCFKNGIQLLSFDQRIGFHKVDKMKLPVEGSPFASAYFCRGVLPKDLIVEKLVKYEKSLI
ncbi:tRNA (adenine-N(6)-)-methyltransferase [Lachnospiraceae bacterium 54-53]